MKGLGTFSQAGIGLVVNSDPVVGVALLDSWYLLSNKLDVILMLQVCYES